MHNVLCRIMSWHTVVFWGARGVVPNQKGLKVVVYKLVDIINYFPPLSCWHAFVGSMHFALLVGGGCTPAALSLPCTLHGHFLGCMNAQCIVAGREDASNAFSRCTCGGIGGKETQSHSF